MLRSFSAIVEYLPLMKAPPPISVPFATPFVIATSLIASEPATEYATRLAGELFE